MCCVVYIHAGIFACHAQLLSYSFWKVVVIGLEHSGLSTSTHQIFRLFILQLFSMFSISWILWCIAIRTRGLFMLATPKRLQAHSSKHDRKQPQTQWLLFTTRRSCWCYFWDSINVLQIVFFLVWFFVCCLNFVIFSLTLSPECQKS